MEMEIKKACPICGKTFLTELISVKYCSDECHKVANKMRKIKNAECKDKGLPGTAKCAICGKDFFKRGPAIYCSEQCRAEGKKTTDMHRHAKEANKPLLTKKCLNCGKTFPTIDPQRKFCTQTCRDIWVAEAFGELKKKRRKQVTSAQQQAKLDDLIQQAEQCGLSYGKYMAQIRFFGKTFEELHEAHLKELDTEH